MRITKAEAIPIFPRLAERCEDRRVDLYGIDHRLVYKLETDNGLTGYGDVRVRPGAAPSSADLDYLLMIDAGGPGLARGLAYGQLNVQTLIQHEAGTLGKAFALHMTAVLPTEDGHSINLDDQYEEDYTTETIPIIEGYSPVPETIGLGFEVDEDELARLAANKPIERPCFIGILHMPSGQTFYGPGREAPHGEEGMVRGSSGSTSAFSEKGGF